MVKNLSSDTVESRRVMLETFLEDILSKSNVRLCDEVVVFLAPSDNYNIPSSKKKVTKLKQPDHLKKQEEERKKQEEEKKKQEDEKRKTIFQRSKPKKGSRVGRNQRTSTLEDIFSKMSPASSFEDLLPSQPNSPTTSPFVENELRGTKVFTSSPIATPATPATPSSSASSNIDEQTSRDSPPSVRQMNLDIPLDIIPDCPASPVRIVRRGRGRGRGGTSRVVPKPQSPRLVPLRQPIPTKDVRRKDYVSSINVVNRPNTLIEEMNQFNTTRLKSRAPPVPERLSNSSDRVASKRRRSHSLERKSKENK